MRRGPTVTHLQERGPIGDITGVADILEMSQTPSLSCRHARLPCLVSSTWHVMNFVKGWQMSESIMSWPAFLHFIYREVNPSWLGSLSPWHQKPYQWQQEYRTLESSGIRKRRWRGIIMSLTSRTAAWASSPEFFHSDFWEMSMPHSWDWSWSISVARGGFHAFMHITSGCSCTSPGCGWWASHFSFATTLRKWKTSCSARPLNSS